eukprot:Selendium_serpulae@DN1078_c0_g1_i1.p1
MVKSFEAQRRMRRRRLRVSLATRLATSCSAPLTARRQQIPAALPMIPAASPRRVNGPPRRPLLRTAATQHGRITDQRARVFYFSISTTTTPPTSTNGAGRAARSNRDSWKCCPSLRGRRGATRRLGRRWERSFFEYHSNSETNDSLASRSQKSEVTLTVNFNVKEFVFKTAHIFVGKRMLPVTPGTASTLSVVPAHFPMSEEVGAEPRRVFTVPTDGTRVYVAFRVEVCNLPPLPPSLSPPLSPLFPPLTDAHCHHAWARHEDSSECFLLIDYDMNGVPDFGHWGWTNGLLIRGSTMTLELWANAERCDTRRGTLVGAVTAGYSAASSKVTLEIAVDEKYHATHFAVHVGHDGLPRIPGFGYSAAHEDFELQLSEEQLGARTPERRHIVVIPNLVHNVNVALFAVICDGPPPANNSIHDD